MATIIGRCGGGCTGIIDSTQTAGDDCGVHSVGATAGWVLTADGFGGSSWATVLASHEEHIITGSVAIAAGATNTFSMSHYDGTSIVDLTTPTKAKVLTKGVYAAGCAALMGGGPAGAAGSQVDVSFTAVQLSGPAWPPGYPVPGAGTAVQPNNALASFTYATATPVAIMFPGDWWQLVVFNAGASNYNVEASISIVKLADL